MSGDHDGDNPRVDIDWAYDEREAFECPDCGARVAVKASDPREVSGVRCLSCDEEMELIAARR
jgi:DNA-directed RNA polymerase subunit RPC12/RpoP